MKLLHKLLIGCGKLAAFAEHTGRIFVALHDIAIQQTRGGGGVHNSGKTNLGQQQQQKVNVETSGVFASCLSIQILVEFCMRRAAVKLSLHVCKDRIFSRVDEAQEPLQ